MRFDEPIQMKLISYPVWLSALGAFGPTTNRSLRGIGPNYSFLLMKFRAVYFSSQLDLTLSSAFIDYRQTRKNSVSTFFLLSQNSSDKVSAIDYGLIVSSRLTVNSNKKFLDPTKPYHFHSYIVNGIKD